MTEEPFEIRLVRGALEQLAQREEALEGAVLELARIKSARSDMERSLARALERAGVTAPAPRATGRGRRATGDGRPADGTDQARVLETLEREGRSSLGVITSRTGLPAGNVSTALQRLAERGFARRIASGTYEPGPNAVPA